LKIIPFYVKTFWFECGCFHIDLEKVRQLR
jgi:hypothetical protein